MPIEQLKSFVEIFALCCEVAVIFFMIIHSYIFQKSFDSAMCKMPLCGLCLLGFHHCAKVSEVISQKGKSGNLLPGVSVHGRIAYWLVEWKVIISQITVGIHNGAMPLTSLPPNTAIFWGPNL